MLEIVNDPPETRLISWQYSFVKHGSKKDAVPAVTPSIKSMNVPIYEYIVHGVVVFLGGLTILVFCDGVAWGVSRLKVVLIVRQRRILINSALLLRIEDPFLLYILLSISSSLSLWVSSS
jgi:hypothetical protein